jgi:hypothetical protein
LHYRNSEPNSDCSNLADKQQIKLFYNIWFDPTREYLGSAALQTGMKTIKQQQQFCTSSDLA